MPDVEPTAGSENSIEISVKPDRLAQPVDDQQHPRLPFPVVGIGASAGGLESFVEFFEAMRSDSGMAFVLILHLPPERESMLAEILSKHTQMPVAQVEDGLTIEANHVYVIRPGHTMTIHDGRLHLGQSVEKSSHRRPVDDFFRSLAEEQRERAICIIMSGMGSNGTAGAQVVKAVGGICIAQDPESAKFPDMPHNMIESGNADFILGPREMPEILIRYSTHPYAKGSTADIMAVRQRQALNEILAVIRMRTRQDFHGYKMPTLVRRIERRMGLAHTTEIDEYVRTLRKNPAEVAILADDMMIHVTGFFRDPESWESLRQRVIVPLVADRDDGAPIRAWVTACSSGEEAYTLAILLTEAADAAGKRFDIKIFATDTADRSLSHARTGLYPGGIESEISLPRLEAFFDRDDANYRVKKELRQLVTFAPQNVLHDPPFSRLDICTCRNLLIYLEPEVQRRVLALLHFGIREGGALLLGTSETISDADGMFEPIDKKHRIFRRIGPTRHGSVDFPMSRVALEISDSAAPPLGVPRVSIAQITNRLLLDRYTPPAIVIDRHQHIVYFHGHTERYLDQPRGEPTRELMSLLRESVRGAVRTALNAALSQNGAVIARDGLIETPDGRRRVEVTVVPIDSKGASPHFLISFNEIPEPEHPSPPANGGGEPTSLDEELRRVRYDLRDNVEELQASNEEMKASNEEITSINEELQSTNEELETGKEEMQSLNEELSTVNAQLQTKMEELEGLTNDLSSLLSSTDIGVIFLDPQLRIRRFTPALKDLMDLIPADVGRPLSDLARKFIDTTLVDDVRAVSAKLVPLEKEIVSETGRTYIRRALPYRTSDNHIGGVVVTFVDISERKRTESALRESEERYRLIVQSVKEYAIIMLDAEGRFATWSPGAEKVLGFKASDAIGRHWSILFTSEDRGAGLPEKTLQLALQSGNATEERWCMRDDGSRFWCSGTTSAVVDASGKLQGFVKVLRDMTDRKRANDALEEAKRAAENANEAKDQFLANISHELRTPLSAMLLWANMLLGREKSDPADLREGLEAIKASAEAQKELIEDLLDTSRISAGKLWLDAREVELTRIVESAIEAGRPAAAAMGVNLEINLDPAVGIVRADPHRLQQVIWNLLSNAVKFTPSGGVIKIGMARKGDQVEITVSDTGRGISPEFLPHVFERFGQAHPSVARAKGGLGLGLTISKQLVELHGGTISADSDGEGKGATFTVRLPLPRIHSVGEAVASSEVDVFASAKPLGQFHVLLVEDDAETRKAMSALLREAGAEVWPAESTAAALDEFNRRRPDLILSDIGLPDSDGYDLIRQIRALEKSRKVLPVPAIALTAFAFEKDRRKAHESGFQKYLAKPIDPVKLIRTMAAMLSER